MPALTADRVKETWTGSGATAVTLAGAVSSFQSFSNGIGVGNKCYYLIDDPTNNTWEIGKGTLTTATNLSRDNIILTLSGGATGTTIITFAAGSTKTVLAFNSSAALPSAIVSDPNLASAIGTKGNPFTAGAALTLGQNLYIDQRDGKVYTSEADVVGGAALAWTLGLCTEAASSSASVNVQQAGILPGLSGLTANNTQWASNTAGSITDATPLNEIYQGLAVSTTQLLQNDLGDRFNSGYYLGEKGYMGGGGSSAGVPQLWLQKFTFLEVASQNASGMQTAVAQSGYVSEGSYKGFFTGGATSNVADTTVIQKVLFSSDTTSTIAAVCVASRENPGSLSERRAKGYTFGGQSTATGTQLKAAEKIIFAVETNAAQTTANLSANRQQALGTVNEGNFKGYEGGGNSSAANTAGVTTIDILYYAQDVTANRTALALSSARGNCGGMSNGTDKGYFVGGATTTTSALNIVDKITFANDTDASSTTNTLDTNGRAYAYSISQGQSYGFVCGGWTGSKVAVNIINKFNFATDTQAASTATLVQAVFGAAGISDVGL